MLTLESLPGVKLAHAKRTLMKSEAAGKSWYH